MACGCPGGPSMDAGFLPVDPGECRVGVRGRGLVHKGEARGLGGGGTHGSAQTEERGSLWRRCR